MFRSECAEFPNDNPELHDGAIWICASTCGAAVVVRPDPKVSEQNIVASHEAAVAREELKANVANETADWLDEPAVAPFAPQTSIFPVPLPREFEEHERAVRQELLATPIEALDDAPPSETFSAAIVSVLTMSSPPPPVEPERSSLDEPEEDLIAAALDGAHEAVAEEIAGVRELERVPPLASGFFPVSAESRTDMDDSVDPLPEVGAEIEAAADVAAEAETEDAEGDFIVEEMPPLEETSVETVYLAAEPAEKVSEQLREVEEPIEAARSLPEVAEVVAVVPEKVSEQPEKVSEQLQADPYAMLAQAMANVAIQHGQLVEARAVQSLLFGERVEGLSADRIQRLIAVEIIDPAGRAAEKVATVANAWSSILRGESEDWSAVGASSLDEWAAQILSRFLENSAVGQLQKELREQGVAAFGLATAA